MPNLYVIAGCNGAGKTTASYTVLPELLHCKQFVNADEIARGLSPFDPETVAIEAGRIMLSRIKEIENLSKLYMPVCNAWTLIDNSDKHSPVVIAQSIQKEIKIHDSILYTQIINHHE